ncbi:hypothetical protein [Paenibacillus albidus]|uniref:hypothetical protein n=1 Tax=Paenibacillus albidus TaxID=2041023 RepID=UPI00166AE111|nr:hypothetical protein [Paenibacillus albidus]
MAGSSDKIVMLLIGAAIVVFLIYRLYLWLQTSPRSFIKDKIPINKVIHPHPAVDLLEEAGYEVVGGKLKIPLSFTLNGSRLYSQLFIDYIAVLDEDEEEDQDKYKDRHKDKDPYYLVILARPRKQLEFTGSGLRDAVLPYLLIYPQCSGILYVNPATSAIHRITFGRDDGESN